MSASDVMKNGGVDINSAKENRENRLNPAEYQPGQQDNFDSLFSDTVLDIGAPQPVQTSTGGMFPDTTQGVSGLPQANGAFPVGVGDFNSLMQPQLPQTPQEPAKPPIEDRIIDASKIVFKDLIAYAKDIIHSFSTVNVKFAARYGRTLALSSAVMCGVGVVLSLFTVTGFGLSLVISGLTTTGGGLFLLLFKYSDAKKCEDNGVYKDVVEEKKEEVNTENFPNASESDWFNQQSSLDSDASEDYFGEDYDSEDEDDFGDDDDDLWGSSFDSSSESLFTATSDIVEKVSKGDIDKTLAELTPTQGMFTRQYMYETISKNLINITPNFADMHEIMEDDAVFLNWESYLREASGVSGVKDEDLPTLLKMEENIFIIKLTCTRTSGFKADAIADELSRIYANILHPDDMSLQGGIFANAVTFGRKCVITVFNSENSRISLKDTYLKCKDFVLALENMMPIVLGVNELGKVIYTDFKNVESLIVSGAPRMGKSWWVQSFLFQMCCYLSPKELNIYILDPKADTSDYCRFKLPHVKRFASEYIAGTGTLVNKGTPSIVKTLTELADIEVPRRRKILADAGCVNILDFKKKYPDVPLPFIYVVIDEMVTLSSMEKEHASMYFQYIDMIVTQFPNLGIRGVFIPHEVKNQIISKTAYDAISCRINVCGSPSQVESSTGAKAREFKYRLSNKGDMAVYFPQISTSTMFVHAMMLSNTNEENNLLFDFVRRVWASIMPEEEKNSVAKDCATDIAVEDLVKAVDLDDLGGGDDVDLGFTDVNALSGLDDF